MARKHASGRLSVYTTIATLLASIYLLLLSGPAAAEPLETMIASYGERKQLARFYVEHLDRTLMSRPEALQYLREKYATAQAAYNSRITALIACIHRHRRDGPESCSILDLAYGIQAIDNFINEAKAVLLHENKALGRKMNLGKDILVHTGIAWIFERLRDLGSWIICPNCGTADELIMELQDMMLPDWDQVLTIKRGVACAWQSFSAKTEKIATFTVLLFNVADDADAMTMRSTQKSLTSILYISEQVLE